MSKRLLHTVSLRRRVTIGVLLVLCVVLVGLVLLVNTLFAAQYRRSLNTVLTDRVQLAQQLARQGVAPEMLIRRVDARSVRAELVLPDGRAFGSLNDHPAAVQESAPRQVRLTGRGNVNGATLTVTADTSVLDRAQSTLLQVLVFTGLCALILTAGLLVVTVRFALAPLDAMTGLARSIAQGDRGRRLSPARTDTELGRTAGAFDEMLDALEGAERQARAAEAASKESEERTKRFVADAAHELRTPLTGVQAAAQAVVQQAPDADPAERERLQMLLVRESRRAGQLVNDLLDLARIDAGVDLRHEPVDLLELACSEADRVRLVHPNLDVGVTGQQAVATGDPARITQILANLLDNACQATPGGGQVSISVEPPNGVAEVWVRDTGPGVPASERERIFDRMVRLEEARTRRTGGSGLGLTIARGLARAGGGDLTCEEPPAGTPGAAFRLVLPVAPTAPGGPGLGDQHQRR